MAISHLTKEQERYLKTSLATKDIKIYEKFGRSEYIKTAATSADLKPATYPAGSIVRLNHGGTQTFTLDVADDSYQPGDEILFVQTVAGCKCVVQGADAAGTKEAPVIYGSSAGSAGAGKNRLLRKVSNYATVTQGPLDETVSQLDGSVTTGGTGMTATTYTNVTLANASTGGGYGSGAKATVIVASATALTSIEVTTAGDNYAAGDILEIAAGDLGGSSTKVVITLKKDDLAGTVAAEWDISLTA